jgi:hypothetical protein
MQQVYDINISEKPILLFLQLDMFFQTCPVTLLDDQDELIVFVKEFFVGDDIRMLEIDKAFNIVSLEPFLLFG